jgi:hypothetical protein
MTITTTFVTVLRRFKYLAEKVMYSNHYKLFEFGCKSEEEINAEIEKNVSNNTKKTGESV